MARPRRFREYFSSPGGSVDYYYYYYYYDYVLTDQCSRCSEPCTLVRPPTPPPPDCMRLTNNSICDIQEKFRPAIYEYPKVISTAQKLISACTTLRIPIYATTQSSSRLGPICSELTAATPNNSLFTIDKTAFSMLVPDLRFAMQSNSPNNEPYQVAIVGIETHICVTQTALDLLSEGHRVYVLVDGVSSCNAGERTVALERLRAEGAIVTSSEGWLYECMGDAGIPEFKTIAGLVKETKESTKDAVQTLCKM